jgi:hypothetical protein
MRLRRYGASFAVLVVASLALTSCSVSLPIYARFQQPDQLQLAYCQDVTVNHYRLELRRERDEIILSESFAEGPIREVAEGEIVDLSNVGEDWVYGESLDFSLDWDSYWVIAMVDDKQTYFATFDRAEFVDESWVRLKVSSWGSPECDPPPGIYNLT